MTSQEAEVNVSAAYKITLEVKSQSARRSGGSRIVQRGRGSVHHPMDLSVHRNAAIFELVWTFDHILFP